MRVKIRMSYLVVACAAGCASQPVADPVEPAAPPVVVTLDEAPEAETREIPKSDDDAEPEADPEAEREAAVELARKAGILGVLQAEDGEAASIFGQDSSLSGQSTSGGGGTGLGSVGTLGRGSGTGSGYGRGAGRLGGKRPSRVRAGASDVTGSLDKAIIQRIVRRHIAAIRYCYEKELVKTPDLSGRIVVRFVIGTDGNVASAKAETSLKPEVDGCVIGVFQRMIFPKPDGGGVVTVKYPLVFSSSADGS